MKERGWVEACDLAAGDELSSSSGNWTEIEAIHRDGSIATVYNMTIQNWHTYFIGTPTWGFDVWVHNNHAGGPSKTVAQLNREASIAKGIPESQLGPSGLPKIHTPSHSSLKKATEAGRRRVGKGGTTVKHPRPRVGNPHIHGVKPNGIKIRIHDEFPKVN